jgi:hypothetical protein
MTDYDEAKAIAQVEDEHVEDPRSAKFTVTEPTKVQGYI